MADGPLDYDSGYIFKSQKGISDRRAARGFPPGSGYACQGSGSTGRGKSLIAALLFGALSLMWKTVEVITPILLMLLWKVTKFACQMVVAIASRSRVR